MHSLLDPIDAKIVEKLRQNGRVSLTDLAGEIDLSRVAIAHRIEKLIRTDLIRVGVSLNLDKLNYQTLLVEMQVSEDKADGFKQHLAKCPMVLSSFEVTGKYNFLIVCSGRNNEVIRRFIERSLKKYSKDCNVVLASNPNSPKFLPIKSMKRCKECGICFGGVEDGTNV